MKYIYIGKEPMRIGGALINQGAILDFRTPPDKNWTILNPKPVRREVPVIKIESKIEEKTDG